MPTTTMSTPPTVLLLGATGRTGRKVLGELLDRGLAVRAIVRSRARLPAAALANPRLSVTEAELLALPDQALLDRVRGCDAVVSCLGHVLSLGGIFGPPRDLVARATRRVCEAIEALRPARPVKVVLMSSVSVHRGRALDPRRGVLERAFLWALRGALPPARDNQAAADFLVGRIGDAHPFVQWVAVRPDTLLEGDVSGYTLHDGLVNGLFSPGRTRMANVAHFMGELVADPGTWARWKGKLPVIVDAAPGTARGAAATPA